VKVVIHKISINVGRKKEEDAEEKKKNGLRLLPQLHLPSVFLPGEGGERGRVLVAWGRGPTGRSLCEIQAEKEGEKGDAGCCSPFGRNQKRKDLPIHIFALPLVSKRNGGVTGDWRLFL